MGLKICSFASGSTGNCILVASDTTKILVDVGISSRRVFDCLKKSGTDATDVSVVVTHAHSDHIRDVPGFSDMSGANVYAHRNTSAALMRQTQRLIEFDENDFFIGDITVSPFRLSHDVHCLGYSFYHQGKKISIATDLGYISPGLMENLSGSDIVFLEANYDASMLMANNKYPVWLKSRILSEKGHLSNSVSADAVLELAKQNVRKVILGHLSQENNYPELVYSTVTSRLAQDGIREGRDINIEIALHDKMSEVFDAD